jgi:hypothetical protein
MKSTEHALPAAAPAGSAPRKRRLYLGVAVFALSWALTLAVVPLITMSGLPTSAKATLTGEDDQRSAAHRIAFGHRVPLQVSQR